MKSAEIIELYKNPQHLFVANDEEKRAIAELKTKLKSHKTECIVIHSDRFVRYDDGTWPAALLPEDLWSKVVLDHKDLAARYTTSELCKLMSRALGKEYHSKDAKEKIAQRLWNAILPIAVQGSAGKPIERRYGVKVEEGHIQRYGVVYKIIGKHVDEKGNFSEGGAPRKIAPQAATIVNELLNLSDTLGRDELTEPEVMAHINTLIGKLKTKQDPWRVFQFYRNALIQHGFITMEKHK